MKNTHNRLIAVLILLILSAEGYKLNFEKD